MCILEVSVLVYIMCYAPSGKYEIESDLLDLLAEAKPMG